jgi:hypothetical protein
MAKSKKNKAAKPKVEIRDMEPKKDPKGGALNEFLKIEGSTSIKFLPTLGSTSYKPQ